MKKIIFATHNKHKSEELSAWLDTFMPGKFEVVTSASLGLPDPVEDGDTFAENAFIKASSACRLTGEIAIADDSGLCVDALDGAPGVYSARYAGDGASSDACIDKLLNALKDVPDEKRTARFVCCICMLFPDGRRIEASGEVEGMILRQRMGNGNFGYDPVFYYPPFGQTFAQAELWRKNTVSHRGRALKMLGEKLSDTTIDY